MKKIVKPNPGEDFNITLAPGTLEELKDHRYHSPEQMEIIIKWANIRLLAFEYLRLSLGDSPEDKVKKVEFILMELDILKKMKELREVIDSYFEDAEDNRIGVEPLKFVVPYSFSIPINTLCPASEFSVEFLMGDDPLINRYHMRLEV